MDQPRYIKRIATARHFIELHSVDSIELWRYSEWYQGDERYLAIHNNMKLGRYGVNERQEDGLLKITIPANESKSGLHVDFIYE